MIRVLLLSLIVGCVGPGGGDKGPASSDTGGSGETASMDTCAPTCDDTGHDSTADTGHDTGHDTGADTGHDTSTPDSTDSTGGDTGDEDTSGGSLDLTDADAKLLGEDVDDHAGLTVSDAGDVDGDGLGDLAVMAPTGRPGIVYVMQHPASGTVSLAESEGRFIADGIDEYGMTSEVAPMDGGADMDGDGYADILVGTPFSGVDSEGWTWLLQGPVVGDLYFMDVDAALYGGENEVSGAGVAWIGDMNGDGWEDLSLGASGFDGEESSLGECAGSDEEYYGDEYGRSVGALFVMLGPVSGTVPLDGFEARLVGEDGGDFAGRTVVPADDLNGDGDVDLFVAGFGNCEGGSQAGAAYVVHGPISGEGLLADADAKLMGESARDRAGETLAVVGDTNGDGWVDVLVGAPDRDTLRGETYLVLGPLSGTESLSTADASFTGEAMGDYSGTSIVGVGDQDGDGNADIAIGAPYAESDILYGGAVYLLYGPQTGSNDLEEADVKFTGGTGGAGYSLANLGDVDADGLPDLLIGASGDDEGAAGAGAAYLLLGGGTLLSSARAAE